MRDFKKGMLLVFFYSFIAFSLQAQNNSGFMKTFGTSMHEHPFGIAAGNQGDIVICGNKAINIYSHNQAQATIYLLDSLGNIKSDKTFNNFNYLIDIAQTESGYTFFGCKTINYPQHESKFVILKTDYYLNLIDSFHVFLMDTLSIGSARAIIDSKGDFLMSGYFNSAANTFIPFVYKISETGVIIESKIGTYNGYIQGLNIRILEDFDRNGYYLFDQLGNGVSTILHLDSNLNLSASGSLAMPNNTQTTHDVVKIGSDKLFYLSNNGPDPSQYYAVCLDTSNSMHYFKEFGNPQQHDLTLDGLSFGCNSLFITSMSLPDQSNLHFPDDSNSIKVIKMDTAFNIQWNKNIGWDAYYLYPNVQATYDGGCLVMGSVYDKDTMSQQHDIVLFKLDSNGNITGTHRIEDAAGQSLKTYPNPGEDFFNLDMPIGKGTLRVFNQNGQLLFEQPLTKGRNKIDMKPYASGVYFLRLTNEQNRNVGSGKWIKL